MQITNSGFYENQTRYYNELLESQEMSDITLACDGYEVGAHKTIISASSQFFREVIRKSKHVNPYIYLKGVSKETLETMIKFIYVGEATARTDNLENLVEAGNELKIFGIMEDPIATQNCGSNKKETKMKSVDKKYNAVHSKQNDTDLSDNSAADFVKMEQYELELEEEDESKDESARWLKEIKKRITVHTDDSGNEIHMCNVCNREFSNLRSTKLHIETHLEGFSHKCKFCDVVKRTKKSLWYHKSKYHKSVNNETYTGTAETQEDDKKEVQTATSENESEMDIFCEDMTTDGESNKKVAKTKRKQVALSLGELVDETNKERFDKELENLIFVNEENCLECKVCQKQLKRKLKQKMKLHVEIHLDGFSHKCKFCETVKKTLRSIQLHEYEQHTRSGTDTTDEIKPEN